MDIAKIKTLTKLMVDNDLTEIMIRDGEQRIVLRRGSGSDSEAPQVVMATPVVQPAAHLPAPAAQATPGGSEEEDAGLSKIKAPLVGTFYMSPDPKSPPFVNVGDTVTPDTVVCIIVAMKVHNEIKAEVSGKIESIEVQNEQAVEFGQVMFRVRTG
ncbi:MAG: acetyl-CoA carboxylase biotin carboxyl carrier protein [Planctomycetota bacterium]|nr:acetyl-CoA carboxylase biotin carboxyl carrier protein [Planctomycetota bacterium]MCZ6699529.1 acetyl-CoA carboxylase biotin carboxyl carrier protein [Planctomycetota bacterium]